MRSMSYLYIRPLPPMTRSTIPQHHCAFYSLSFTSRIHSTVTALSCQRVWDSWGKIVVLHDSFDAKAWGEALERDLSSDDGIDSESDSGA